MTCPNDGGIAIIDTRFKLPSALAGLFLGGGHVWAGLATLPVLAIGDALLPRDYAALRIRSPALALVPVFLPCFLWAAMLLVLAWQLGYGGYSTVEGIGAVLSAGWIGTAVGLLAYHGLLHRRSPWTHDFALCTQVMLLAGDAARPGDAARRHARHRSRGGSPHSRGDAQGSRRCIWR